MMTAQLKEGQVVAFCHSGNYGCNRLRNVTVTRVKKTFIEIEDGSRYSVLDYRQIKSSTGERGFHGFYIDPQVSYWDTKADRERVIQELNSKFEALIAAARTRDWEDTKAAFEALSILVGE